MGVAMTNPDKRRRDLRSEISECGGAKGVGSWEGIKITTRIMIKIGREAEFLTADEGKITQMVFLHLGRLLGGAFFTTEIRDTALLPADADGGNVASQSFSNFGV